MMSKKELQKFFYEENKKLMRTNEEETFEQIKQRITYLPSKLYKFRSGYTRDFKALKQNKVWFSKPDDCDDPMDTTLNINFQKDLPYLKDFLQENFVPLAKYITLKLCPALSKILTDDMIKIVLEKCYDNSGNLKQDEALHFCKEHEPNLPEPIIRENLSFMDKLRNIQDYIPKETLTSFEQELVNINDDLRNKSMIYCLSETKDEAIMWAFYAKNYSGFCIEYDLASQELMKFTDKILNIFPVTYGKINHFNMTKVLIQKLIKEYGTKDLSQNDELEILTQVLMKKNSWKFEKEWRCVLPYAEKMNLQKFLKVKAVYIGYKAKQNLVDKIIDIASKNHFEVFLQQQNQLKTKLIYKKIFSLN